MTDIIETQKVIRGEEIKLDLEINPVEGYIVETDEEGNTVRSSKEFHFIGTDIDNFSDCFPFKCEFYTEENFPIITMYTERNKYKPMDSQDNIIEWDVTSDGINNKYVTNTPYDRGMFTVPTIELNPGKLLCKITAYIPDVDFSGDEIGLESYLNNKRTVITRVKTNVVIIE